MGHTFNDADSGCGIAHYPSGKVAALVTKVSGFKYFAFFDSNTEGKLIAAFTQGVGFVHWGGHNGAPRFVAKAAGAYQCDEAGQVMREWEWTRNGKEQGVPAACGGVSGSVHGKRRAGRGTDGSAAKSGVIEFRVNNHMRFRCSDAYDMTVRVTMSSFKHTFTVGRPPHDKDSFTDRMHRQRAAGQLNHGAGRDIGASWPTLRQRTAEAARVNPNVAACRQAQLLNERLPRISASGREVKSFCAAGLKLQGTRAVVAQADLVMFIGARAGSLPPSTGRCPRAR